MQCSKSSHKIVLKNLENNSSIFCDLYLVKGSVGSCDLKDEILETCELDSEISIVNSKTKEKFYGKVNGKTGQFRILIELVCGLQTLHFKYCCGKDEIHVNLKESSTPYTIQPLLIVSTKDENCNDSVLCKKIDLNFRLLQWLFLEKISEHGQRNKTFRLKNKCQFFQTSLNLEESKSWSDDKLWTFIGKELLNSKDFDENCKYFGFLQFTSFELPSDYKEDFSYENLRKYTYFNPALACGQLGLFGAGYFYSWPKEASEILSAFENNEKINEAVQLDNSNYRRTFSGVYASSLGGVMHEMGHLFELGHDGGIMGSAFDYLNQVFVDLPATENLPERCFNEKSYRFTNLRKKTEGTQYLDRYYEQKFNNDSFFFSKNCVSILANHLWLQVESSKEVLSKIVLEGQTVLSEYWIAIVEIRNGQNDTVLKRFEFKEKENVTSFTVPENFHSKDIKVFVMCGNGKCRIFGKYYLILNFFKFL